MTDVYGTQGAPPSRPIGVPEPGDNEGDNEVEGNAEWRRIDKDWLLSAEQLALAMNDYTNNSSLVLAFELGRRGKVLLFAADAQMATGHPGSRKAGRMANRLSKRRTC